MRAFARSRASLLAVAASAILAIPGARGAQSMEAEAVAPSPPAQWSSYNNGFKGQRFSPLTGITSENVGSLEEVCRLKVADGGSFHTGPVVVDGTMYLTTPLDTFAVDPTNCNVRWKSSYEPEEVQVYPGNRGVAVMNGRVFRGTADGRLLALDAGTGKLIWKNLVGDPTLNEFLIGAPLAWNGLVITGTSGSDFGIKGRIVAYDALTGREVWRFVTIPTGNEVGADTWEVRQAAETGGGGTWSTLTLDVITGEVFVPVGNPAPSFAPEVRPGPNLFTNSFVVLDARTGALKWWYQLAPNDGHDLDLSAAPMLYMNTEGRDVVAAAGKDGYVHVVDRVTHRLLFKTAVTTIENEGVKPSQKETRFCPGGAGGTEWNGPAFVAATRTIFVGAVDSCTMIKATPQKFVRNEGVMLWGATATQEVDRPARGWVHALDSDSGQIKWKYHADAPIVAGITPTAGGVVLTGDTAGNLLALDSATGRVLYKKNTGGAIAGGVITYAIDGRQYVAFTSGNISRSIFGAVGIPTIVIAALNATSAVRGSVVSGSAATGGSFSGPQGAHDLERGRELYAQNCSVCHGPHGEGGAGKSLKKLAQRQRFEATVEWLENPRPPMPKLFPSPLGEQAVRNIAAFIRTF
jgi:alcohol dehydrogenase (cytochrome c)